jgi:AhpC/TSA family
LHDKDRDKFEILAFHDGTVKDFKDLDSKVGRVRDLYWKGHDLPFPILLDATGKTIKDYDVHAFPTTILIDPQGKLVGEATEEQLEAKLTPVPLAARLARAMDKNVNFFFDDPTLTQAMRMLSAQARVPIRLESKGLKTAAVDPDAKIPFKMSGMVSLRSALDLTLDGLNLDYLQDEKGILITARKTGAARTPDLSGLQRDCARRIDKVLDGKVSFDFKDKPLEEVAQHFERLTNENFVLEPSARRAGLLDPKTTVTGSAKDLPLREGLRKLLEPVGIGFVVRDEVVALAPRSKAAAR